MIRTSPICAVLGVLGLMASPEAGAQSLNAVYVCEDAHQVRYVVNMTPNGQIQVSEGESPQKTPGTYTYNNRQMRLIIPSIGFDQTSTRAVEQKGLLLAFETPAIFCGLMRHDKGPAVEGYARCPKIGYIPSIGWQENAFEFYGDRSVKWRRWDEYLSLGDTTYSESFGVYLIEGSVLSMVFPFREKEDVLTGTINPDYSFLINELEPQKGPCVPAG